MSVYFVAQIKFEDTNEYQLYLNDCDDIFSIYNGKYLAVDLTPEVLEGEWNYSRSILIEFPSEKDLKNGIILRNIKEYVSIGFLLQSVIHYWFMGNKHSL